MVFLSPAYVVTDLRFPVLVKIDNITHGAELLRFLVDNVHVLFEFLMRFRSHFSSFLSLIELQLSFMYWYFRFIHYPQTVPLTHFNSI